MWRSGGSRPGGVIPARLGATRAQELQGVRVKRQSRSLWRFTLTPWLKKWEPADKPGSVQRLICGNHSSGTAVTGGLLRPTRKRRGPRHRFPIWSCSGWGLPSRSVLPPARCALTAPFHPYQFPGGIFSVALSVGSRPPGVTWHPALRSPDFPPRLAAERLPGRLPGLLSHETTHLREKWGENGVRVKCQSGSLWHFTLTPPLPPGRTGLRKPLSGARP